MADNNIPDIAKDQAANVANLAKQELGKKTPQIRGWVLAAIILAAFALGIYLG